LQIMNVSLRLAASREGRLYCSKGEWVATAALVLWNNYYYCLRILAHGQTDLPVDTPLI